MPVAHTLRRWLWRVNGVLALGAIAVWVLALTDDPGSRPVPQLPEPREVVSAAPLGPDISWDEMVALVRPFHGRGEGNVHEQPVAKAPPDGRLPLAAYELRMWIQDPGGPDSIVLNSKDPAHSDLLLPKEGRPDQGVGIESIERRHGRAFITVSRGEERFTYPVVDLSAPTAADERIVRVTPRPATDVHGERLAAASAIPGRIDVKVLPFFGTDGQVAGARVTGVRAGSAFARAGLRAGDVIVSVDDASFASVDGCRARLTSEGWIGSLRIRDGAKKLRRLDIDS